jgi:hypothetical protein
LPDGYTFTWLYAFFRDEAQEHVGMDHQGKQAPENVLSQIPYSKADQGYF